MSRFDTTGSGHIPVGDAGRFHFSLDDCNHQGINVCPECAELTAEELAAIREYVALLTNRAKGGQ